MSINSTSHVYKVTRGESEGSQMRD